MKKATALLLALLLFLTACAGRAVQTQADGFLFYYPAADGSTTLVSVPGPEDAAQLSLDELLRAYLDAAPPENGRALCASRISLFRAEQDGSTILLTFRGARITGLEQSLFCVCLTRTLAQLPEVQRVSFSLPGIAQALILTENDIFLTDTGMLPQQESVTLYFPDAQRRYLVRETVLAEAMSAEEKPAFIMQQLLSGSSGGQLNSCIPEGTTLLDLHVENGICSVNLSSEFSTGLEMSWAAERMAVYSIVNSLTELPEIATVDLLVAGAPVERLYLMDLSSGLTRDERLLAADGTTGVLDLTLYPIAGENGLLAAVPVHLEAVAEQSAAETAMEALLSYEGRDGLRACVPAGTKLLSLRTANGNCVVDLTGEFLASCTSEQEERLAVRAVVATLCAQPGIFSVDILVEGLSPVYRDEMLSSTHQRSASWFAN